MNATHFFRSWILPTVAVIGITHSLAISQDASNTDSSEDKAAAVAAELDALAKAHQEKVDAHYKEYRALSTADEKRAHMAKYPDAGVTAEAMLMLVQNQPKSKEALTAAKWILRNSRSAPSDEVVKLIDAHCMDEGFKDLALACLYTPSEKTGEVLKKAIEENPHVAAKAAAAYALSYKLGRVREPNEEQKKQRRKYLDLVVEHGGDLKLGQTSIAERAKGAIFEMENLQIGKVAPDIKGEDVEGVEFSLADYRGKVVVIDFWGDW